MDYATHSLKNGSKKLKTKNEDKLTKDTVTPLNKICCKLASQFDLKMKFEAPTAEKRMNEKCWLW